MAAYKSVSAGDEYFCDFNPVLSNNAGCLVLNPAINWYMWKLPMFGILALTLSWLK